MALTELIGRNDRVYALSADLGVSSGLQRLMNDQPQRFLNVGIAEQNLIGVSAGLAKAGLIPFASSFAPFITLRCADQIRMNMGYMHLNIKTIGLGSGVSMGGLGNSHFGIDDISLLRCIPGIVVLSPADCAEVVKSVEAAAEYDGPVYIRLTGESGMPVVHSEDFDFEIGKAIKLRSGSDVAILATGSMVANGLKAAEQLSNSGIDCSVLDFHTVKPLDVMAIDSEIDSVKLIVTIEEHSVIGGFGAAVAQYLAQSKQKIGLISIGLPDAYLENGSYQYLLERCGLTADAIAEKVRLALA